MSKKDKDKIEGGDGIPEPTDELEPGDEPKADTEAELKPEEPGDEPEALVEEVPAEEEPAAELVPLSEIGTGNLFSYGGSTYRVMSSIVLVEETEKGGRGQMSPTERVEKV